MYNRETEPNWAEELEEDVKNECMRYGPLVHVSVDKDSAVSTVYMNIS